MTCPECDGVGTVPHGDGDQDCWRCEGSGEIDPDLERWEAEVVRGIQAHRERNLDW